MEFRHYLRRRALDRISLDPNDVQESEIRDMKEEELLHSLLEVKC